MKTMSVKEERFVILEDEVTNRFLIAEVMDNGLLLNDSRNCGPSKSEVCIQPEKNLQESIIKKEFSLTGFEKANMMEYSFNCAVCQNVCNNCKSICITCKSQCRKCLVQSCKNSSTDTDDFDKYLESQTKKIKPQSKVKTIGIDTCDLEGHFDYYKLEKKIIKIQKHVATDCADLNVRKIPIKKPVKNSIGVDTSDLNSVTMRSNCYDSDCEFFWKNKDAAKTYSKKLDMEKSHPRNTEKHCEDDISENSLVIDEDASCFPIAKEESKKEEISTNIISKLLTFDDSSTSDESDVDLATSCRLSKCRKLARFHRLTLKQNDNGEETSYECSICNEIFSKKHKGILHLGKHIESNFFKCLSCDEKFESLDFLYSHMKDNHQQVSNIKSEIENKENSGTDFSRQKVNKIYHCMLCTEGEQIDKFDSFKALNIHKKEKHGISKTAESDCEKTEKKPRIKREFICLICGKQFKSSKALKDHSPVHTGEKNYHCDICKKSYTTSANLKIHKRTHTGAKNFVCSVCGKAFHKKDSLKVHFRKHSGERPFQCDLCPMKFDRNYILKNHRYTHFSEKTFICPVCGKTFTTHGGLNNHEKGHKKDPFAKKPRKPAVKPTLDAENAVICDVCGKIYSTRSNLRIHKFVHLGVKPFECNICHQTYAKKDSMLTHMRKHTDERPFACETCGMTFYRNHTLKTHLLRHTGERPHKCKMCGKSFTQSSSLAYHVKNHDRKIEKKKITDDPNRAKKKRVNPGINKLGRAKKVQRNLKPSSGIQTESVKSVFADKKAMEGSSDMATLKNNSIPVINASEKELTKGPHFMLPVPEKEIIVLDKNLGVELPRNLNAPRDSDLFNLDKEISYGGQYNGGKFNYYIAKSHVFSVPKDTVKSKMISKEAEMAIEKDEEEVENLIISKNSYITKEGNLVTLTRDSSLKDVKEFMQIGDQRLDLKPQTALPITGEILNATFISDENGDVIPLNSMTLHGLGSENVMISPLIPIESDDRKGFFRNSKLAMLDSKITYNLAAASRISSEKSQAKGNYHVINLKDSRIPQKIQIELESPALQLQNPVDDGTLHSMSVFYNNVQQNEI